MRHHTTRFLAAAVLVGGIGMATRPLVAADDEKPAASPSLPAGIKAKDVGDEATGVRKTFTTLTEAAVKKGGFDDAVERLVDADRNRIGKFAEQEFTTLDGRIDQIRKTWKDKYGDDFEADEDEAFQKVAVIRGEIEDPKQLAGKWPLRATAGAQGQPQDDAVTAGAAQPADADAAKSEPGLNTNIEKGRDVAVATVPASHGLPQLNVSLIHEAGGYRIDVPDTVTGQQFHDKLLAHLTQLGENANQWPAEKKDAAMMFAHHVLMAAYGLDAPKADANQQQPGTSGSSQNQNAIGKD